jgi:hypothetical protein
VLILKGGGFRGSSCRQIIPLVSDNNTLIYTSILGTSAVKNQVPKVAVVNASIGIQLRQPTKYLT